MGVFDKLAFWKRKDELAVPDVASYGTNLGLSNPNSMESSLGLNQDPLQRSGFDLSRYTQNELGQQEQQGEQPSLNEFQAPNQVSSFSKLNQIRPQQQMQPGNDAYSISKNIEVLSARMDTIKAMLDNLTEKVNKIEEMAEAEQTPHKRANRW